MSRVKIAPATTDAVHAFWDGPPPSRVKAWAATIDDEVIGLGGVYFLQDGTRVAFVDLAEEGYRHPKELIRTTRAFLDQMRADGISRLIAVADPSIEPAERFLLHFGFQPSGSVNGSTIYLWK